MAKIQKVHTNETILNNKRKNIIKNSTYGVIVVAAIMLGATLVSVGMQSNDSNNNLTIQTSTETTTFNSPLANSTILKDYNSAELQYNDTLKQWEIHKGIDLVSDSSNEVFAIGNGTVTNLYTNYLEGTVIEISHSNGIVSVYKSLDQGVKVSLGDSIKAGQKIGTTSSSMARELNSGNHLHFEMLLNNELVNPNNYIDFSNK